MSLPAVRLKPLEFVDAPRRGGRRNIRLPDVERRLRDARWLSMDHGLSNGKSPWFIKGVWMSRVCLK
jgi:hypothetical protein